MIPFGFIKIDEFRDLDEQMASFLLAASVVVLTSWGMIRYRKWLGSLAILIGVVSGLLILAEVWWTKGWHFPHTSVHLPRMYLITAYLSASMPLLVIIALMARGRCRAKRAEPKGTRLNN